MLKQMFLVMFELMFLVMFKQADPPPPHSQMGAPPGAYEVAHELEVLLLDVAVELVSGGQRPLPVLPQTSAHSAFAGGLRGDVPAENPGEVQAGLPGRLASVPWRPCRYREYGRDAPLIQYSGGVEDCLREPPYQTRSAWRPCLPGGEDFGTRGWRWAPLPNSLRVAPETSGDTKLC